MEDRPGAGPAEASDPLGGGGRDPSRRLTGQAPAPDSETYRRDEHDEHGGATPPETPSGGTRAGGPLGWLLDYLPRGNLLDAETFLQRHRLVCWLLGLHLPALFIFGLWRGQEPLHAALAILFPLACLVTARALRPGRLAAVVATAGLVACSAALVHMSGGMIEAHFHFFILLGFIALYQDWAPFLWNVVFVFFSHGVGSALDADSMFNHYAAQNRPWLWASIHGVAVLAACVGVVIHWRHTEMSERRNSALREHLAEIELKAVESEVRRRRSVSALLVHLARRNQALLDRQLTLIADLEDRERQPEPLAELFRLDHLATRMRRNAESLLVLSGDEPPRRWGQPVALEDVVRAATAEVEAYDRVEVLVSEHLDVEGRAVADLTHLLAELIENATTYSPPTSEVRVNSYLSADRDGAFILTVEDTGVGMGPEDLEHANAILSDVPEIDLGWQTLGLHVVSRLARRYGLQVRLADTPGRGTTALVSLPRDIISERRPVPAGVSGAGDRAAALPAGAGSPAGGSDGSQPPPPFPPVAGWSSPDGSSAERHPFRPEVAPHAGLPPVQPGHPGPAPEPPGSDGAGPVTALTPDGLARRVPGQHLAEELRTQPGPADAGHAGVDRESSRASLSRFQASQRAGRAVISGHDHAGGTSGPEAGRGDEPGRGESGAASDGEAVDGPGGGERRDAPTDR